MAFPDTPLDITTELYLNSDWVDVTTDVRAEEGIQITRGRQDEASSTEVSRCALTLDNRSGDYSPRNPVGTYYGSITRNNPIRVSVAQTGSYLYCAGTSTSDFAYVSDNATISNTGDIDIRIELDIDREPIHETEVLELAGKYTTTSDQRSWIFYMSSGAGEFRCLRFAWSTAGTLATRITASASTDPVPWDAKAFRVTLDVNNGASGYDVKYYYSNSITGTWTQLGSTITGGSTTSIYDSTAALRVGSSGSNGGFSSDAGAVSVKKFKMYSDLTSTTLMANIDFTTQTPGDTQFDDSVGNTWNVNGGAEVTNRNARFQGEVSAWPQSWDISGSDITVPVDASGPIRRLSQGQTPLKSAMTRYYTSNASDLNLLAYWPMEDGENATSIATPLPDTSFWGFQGAPQPMVVAYAAPDFASDDSFACSDRLPVLTTSVLYGTIPAVDQAGLPVSLSTDIHIRFLIKIPEAGIGTNRALFKLNCASSEVSQIFINLSTSEALYIEVYDEDGTLTYDGSGDIAGTIGAGEKCFVDITFDGNDWASELYFFDQGTTSTYSGTYSAGSLDSGPLTSFIVNEAQDLEGVVLGHVAFLNDLPSSGITTEWKLIADAYAGEEAGVRMQRLCDEEGVWFAATGNIEQTALMGQQLPGTFLDLLQACADTDMGILHEARKFTGLHYRTRESMCAREPSLTLDYSTADLSGLTPIEDDALTRNDVTVSRIDGSSINVTDTTSSLAVGTIGRYDVNYDISLYADEDTQSQAYWRLSLGTMDEPRYPSINLNFARSEILSDLETGMDLNLGDRIVINNPPTWLPANSISQLCQGFTEYLNAFEYTMDINCFPESPYRVGAYDSDTPALTTPARYEAYDGVTTLSANINTSATSLSVAVSNAYSLWADTDGDFDIVIGGEQMTVTAISGASSPQTFTVTRSVNGIVKSHTAGDAITLALPRRFSI